MKKLAVALSMIAASSVSAFAADLATKPYYKAPALVAAYDWSGFYAGLNAGIEMGRECWNFVGQPGNATPAGPDGCHNGSTNGIVGGQVGYRWQWGSTVFGLEAQGDWANMRSDGNSFLLPGINNQTKTDALGLFTGQIGYAGPNYLLYLKGGAAVTHNNYVQTVIGAPAVPTATGSLTRWGAAAGAGFDYAFAPNWSIGLEYDHLFMDRKNVTLTSPVAAPVTEGIRQYMDIVTLHINYRFGGPVVARY